MKLTTPEIKKENLNFDFWMFCVVNLLFSFKTHKKFDFCPPRYLYGLWAVMSFFCWKHCLGAPVNLFEFGCCSPSFGYISTIKMLKQSSWKLRQNFWKHVLMKRKLFTVANIIEKIRKLPKSSKVYFSQVKTLLKISVVLAVSERFA